MLLNCDSEKGKSPAMIPTPFDHIMSSKVISDLEWLNEPESFEIVDGSLSVTVKKGTDFFNNPEDESNIATAPYIYKSMKGDFVVKALVEPDFASQWNAVAIMVHLDSLNWIKFAFENSDATGPSIVTVVTRGASDDANGVILKGQNQIWLVMARKSNIYSMHWSIDGQNFKMARLASMPVAHDVRVGIEFQSPVGNEATHLIHSFEVVNRTIENLRLLN